MNAASAIDEWSPDTALAGYLIARQPLIVWGPSQPKRSAGPGTVLAPAIGNRRAYFLISLSATRESDWALEADVAEIERLRALYPEHRHIVLCNTRAEVDRFASRSVSAILCSALAYVDETKFVIDAQAPKEIDAIYTATLTPVKRHELCRDISSLALIYHWFGHGSGEPVPEVLAQYRQLLPQARFINDEGGRYRRLENQEVCHWINRARVGLCLSASEGAMLATMEYLLCGVPVVSTPSVGGRARVLDPRFSAIVDPEPVAVADAVRRMAARRDDPGKIRQAAFDAMRADRKRLLGLIDAIYRQESVRFPESAAWIELFRRSPWPVTTIGRLFSAAAIAETPRLRPRDQRP